MRIYVVMYMYISITQSKFMWCPFKILTQRRVNVCVYIYIYVYIYMYIYISFYTGLHVQRLLSPFIKSDSELRIGYIPGVQSVYFSAYRVPHAAVYPAST